MKTKAFILFFSVLAKAEENITPLQTKISDERVVLRTIAGDIVLGFYADLAPKTVLQMRSLIKAGVFDGTHFYRVEDNFVAQMSTPYDKVPALNPDQKNLVNKIPAEFSTLAHQRGHLSMARFENDENSAEGSFSILLNKAPHLDGKYTIFGEVLRGMDVVDSFFKIPRTQKTKPVVRITILKADWFESEAAMLKTPVSGIKPVHVPADALEKAQGPRPIEIKYMMGLLFVALFSSVGVFFAEKVPSHWLKSMLALNALTAAFLLLMGIVPHTQKAPTLAVFAFLGFVGLFRLMGKFESPAK